jgi:hypothetical protein
MAGEMRDLASRFGILIVHPDRYTTAFASPHKYTDQHSLLLVRLHSLVQRQISAISKIYTGVLDLPRSTGRHSPNRESKFHEEDYSIAKQRKTIWRHCSLSERS